MGWMARYVGHSFFTQLIAIFIALIFVTAMAVGLPAYWIISNELEQQAWTRISDAERITQVSLDAERARLANVALLAAQRPSLHQFLQNRDPASLAAYLDTFRLSLSLDLLEVFDSSGAPLANSGRLTSQLAPPSQPLTCFCIASDGRPALFASQPIQDNPSSAITGYVVVGSSLDSDFAHQLANETGFGQSILLGTTRIASSVDNAPPGAVKPGVVEGVITSHLPHKLAFSMARHPYYAVLIPLTDNQSDVIALVEIVMPVESLTTAKHRTLFALALSALVVATLGSVIAAFDARRLTAPLKSLTQAAHEIGQGDLKVTIPFPGRPVEIATLAAALDDSRIKISRTMEELSRVKTWSETLIQSMNEGVVTFDADRRVTFFSRGAARITDWISEEASAQPIAQVLNLPDSEVSQILASIGVKRQLQSTTRSGQRKILAVTSAKVIPPDSDTEQTLLVLRDITDEEMGQRLHTYFLGNITHEFRTPLSGLKASIELLVDESDYLSPDDIRELLNSIHLSVSGLQALVDNLLESVNIEAGRFSINHRPVSLNQVTAEAIRTMQPLLDRRGQRLSLTEPLELPTVYADPTRLTQVLINLLANASKYGPQDETIDLALEQAGQALKITLADRGPGIPPGERAHLFNRFMRAGAQASDQYGIGLGLWVVKAIVEGHGGQVGVDERPGGGSVFWFTIPLEGHDESPDC
jgi:signal transduction histidine kinase